MLLFVDFETYYDKQYSLSKMPILQYLRDERFKCLGAAVAIGDGREFKLKPTWLEGEKLLTFLKKIPRSIPFVAHNAAFDGAVAHHLTQYEPYSYFCTMNAARYLISQGALPPEQSVSLDALYPGNKGNTQEAVEAGGEELRQYALNDLKLLIDLYNKTHHRIPELELDLNDLHVRMAAVPTLDLNTNLLNELAAPPNYPEKLKQLCRSRDKFSEVLKACGVEVEHKTSPRTGKLTPALAKTDEFLQGLLHHKNPKVKRLAELRLELSSNILRTRSARFLDIGAPISLPIKYYAAHTGRSGGTQAINAQNIPPKLKPSILAPEGHKLIIIDSSQVEVRVIAWLAGQMDLLHVFKMGEDPYIDFAARLNNIPQEAITKELRFIAKVSTLALQYGMGHNGFLAYCKQVGAPVTEPHQAKIIVENYRRIRQQIVRFWYTQFEFVVKNGYQQLPSGRVITYPGLTQRGKEHHYHKHQIFSKSKSRERVKLWHGITAENLTQAVARDVVLWQTAELAKKYRVVLSVHDEAVLLVKDVEVEQALQDAQEAFSKPPPWALELPVAGEGVTAEYYRKP